MAAFLNWIDSKRKPKYKIKQERELDSYKDIPPVMLDHSGEPKYVLNDAQQKELLKRLGNNDYEPEDKDVKQIVKDILLVSKIL